MDRYPEMQLAAIHPTFPIAIVCPDLPTTSLTVPASSVGFAHLFARHSLEPLIFERHPELSDLVVSLVRAQWPDVDVATLSDEWLGAGDPHRIMAICDWIDAQFPELVRVITEQLPV